MPFECSSCLFSDAPYTQQWCFTIHTNLLSGNKIGRNAKGRAGAPYRKARSAYMRLLAACWKEIGALRDGVRRQVEITRFYASGKHTYDFDNMVAGCKPVLDNLEDLGYLQEDSPKHTVVGYFQRPSETGLDHIYICIGEHD